MPANDESTMKLEEFINLPSEKKQTLVGGYLSFDAKDLTVEKLGELDAACSLFNSFTWFFFADETVISLAKLSLQQTQALSNALSKFPNFKHFYLPNIAIFTVEQLEAFIDPFSKSKNILEITLNTYPDRFNSIAGFQTHFQVINNAIPNFPNLQKFNIFVDLGPLSPEVFQAFCTALSKCQQLQEIELHLDELNEERLNSIGHALAQCPSFQTLRIGSTRIGDWKAPLIQIFGNAFSSCKHLQNVNLRFGQLEKWTEIEFAAFENVLSKWESLKELNLSNNSINHFNHLAFKAFCIALSRCKNLQVLDLSSNNLTFLQNNTANFDTLFDTLSSLKYLKEVTTYPLPLSNDACAIFPHQSVALRALFNLA